TQCHTIELPLKRSLKAQTRVRIPLGPPNFLLIFPSISDFDFRSRLIGRPSIGQSIGQKCCMEERHGVSELLIPSLSAVRILHCHRIAAELIRAGSAQAMAQ